MPISPGTTFIQLRPSSFQQRKEQMARINTLAIWYHEKLGFQPGALIK